MKTDAISNFIFGIATLMASFVSSNDWNLSRFAQSESCKRMRSGWKKFAGLNSDFAEAMATRERSDEIRLRTARMAWEKEGFRRQSTNPD